MTDPQTGAESNSVFNVKWMWYRISRVVRLLRLCLPKQEAWVGSLTAVLRLHTPRGVATLFEKNRSNVDYLSSIVMATSRRCWQLWFVVHRHGSPTDAHPKDCLLLPSSQSLQLYLWVDYGAFFVWRWWEFDFSPCDYCDHINLRLVTIVIMLTDPFWKVQIIRLKTSTQCWFT